MHAYKYVCQQIDNSSTNVYCLMPPSGCWWLLLPPTCHIRHYSYLVWQQSILDIALLRRCFFVFVFLHPRCVIDWDFCCFGNTSLVRWMNGAERSRKNLEFRQKAVAGFNFEADCQSGLLAEWLDGWLLDYTMFGGSITHVWAASSVEMFQLLQLQWWTDA